MSGRATLVLAAAALAMGVYLFLVERPRVAAEAEVARVTGRLVPFDADTLTALELPLDTGGSVRLERRDGDWRIVAPRALPADPFILTGILTSLDQIRREQEFERGPDELEGFGFDGDPQRVRFEPAEGEPVDLVFGGDAPTGGLVYVRLSTEPDRVFGVTRSGRGTLVTTLFELRDKAIFDVDPSRTVRFAVAVRGESLIDLRTTEAAGEPDESEPGESASVGAEAVEPESALDEGQVWRVVAPLEDRADSGAVFRLLQDLYFARASAFIDAPEAPATYGLDAPELELRAELADGSAHTLAIGIDGQTHYGRVDGAGPVMEVPARISERVPREVFAYRFKRVLRVHDLKPQRFELSFPRDERAVVFRKNPEREWIPDDPDLAIREFKVSDVIVELNSLDAVDVVEPGDADLAALELLPPRVRVDVFDADGASLGWIELGATDSAGRIAARASENDRVWRVAPDLATKIPLGYAAFEKDWLERAPDVGPGSPAELGSDAP